MEKKLILSFSSKREENQKMVDVILSRREDFRVFDTYISEYDRSMSLLEESCRNNSTFANIVKKFEVNKRETCTWWEKVAFSLIQFVGVILRCQKKEEFSV